MKKYRMSREARKEYDKYILKLENYGAYRHGLTDKEIDKYLRVRSRETKYSKYSAGQLRNKFNKIAGINTMAVVICEKCKKELVLMYRHDVLRFADQMFLGVPTYWD